MKEIYIDLGSSTIKVYGKDEGLFLLEEHSLYFKNEFNKETGISDANILLLFQYMKGLKEKYHLEYATTHLFATGIFREIPRDQKIKLISEFNETFDLPFTIISHGLENYYLGKAMEGDYNNKKIMVLNMGGKTTELVTFEHGQITKRHNLKIGVADLLNEFPLANDVYSQVPLSEIVNFVKGRIESEIMDTDYDGAIFTGGEKRFENLTKYDLEPNTLFTDEIHDQMVTFPNFIKGNEHIFFELSLTDLYELMPENPKWMDGARLGAVLPQAIFELAHVPLVIPSDLNLIHGVIKDEG